MLSPVQRWLAHPSVSRWEQPSYDALRNLAPSSASIRKRQAYALWREVFSIRKEVSALAWAKLYATHARLLVHANSEVFRDTTKLDLPDTWLYCASHQLSFVPRNAPRRATNEKSLSVLRLLGHEHVLSQAFVEVFWPVSEQIPFWRQTFPNEPMHEDMHVALGVQAVRRNTLGGYLRARKHLQIHEDHDSIDLSILADD